MDEDTDPSNAPAAHAELQGNPFLYVYRPYGTKTVMKRDAQIGWGPYTPDKSLDFQVQLV